MAKHMRKLSDKDILDALRLYRMRVPLSTIAVHFNVTPSALKYRLSGFDKIEREQLPLNTILELANAA